MNAAPPVPMQVDEDGVTDGRMIEALCADLPCMAVGELLAEDDRRRLSLAQHLHRDVAGGLVVCTTLNEMARIGCEQGDDLATTKETLAKLEAALKQTIQVVREITEEQYPLALKAFGLTFALDKLAKKMSEAGKAEVSVTVEGNEFSLPLEKRLSVYRILEALAARCLRSGLASMVSIHCRFSSSELEFVLLHDGDAPVVTADAELAWVKARIAVLPAQLFVSTADPDGASSLRLVLPVSTQS